MQCLREIINEITFTNFCNEHHVLQHMQYICTAFTEELSPSGCLQVFRRKKSYVFLSKFQMLQIAILGWQKRVAPFPKLQLPYMVWRWLVSLVIVLDQKKIGDTMTFALKLVFNLQIRNPLSASFVEGSHQWNLNFIPWEEAEIHLWFLS